ncbi:MAG: peptide chain release factor N(5)-glutamine methyltransferase, partial [SAR324 cluster bacterium]|nr:peptide chain release factor N(5)-glutamine methyltransferase [SAR324 cluster bacterium]
MHDEPSSQTLGESTITEILQNVTIQFKTGGIASPILDAELLLAFVLKLHRLDLYLQADRPLTTIESREMFELAKLRLDGIPVAYLLEQKVFWSLNLKVFPGVLIPRHETELLAELALPALIK